MNEKITGSELLDRFQPGTMLLPPLMIRTIRREVPNFRGTRTDAVLLVSISQESDMFRFVVEAKARSTPESIQLAIAQAKRATGSEEWPMIVVPYLSQEKLNELEKEQVSGVDLCGNGIVVIPNRLYVLRTGNPNQFPDSRPLNNPYRGRSALVGRMLFEHGTWNSLNSLVAAIRQAGADLSLAQASKAVRALEEDLIVRKLGGSIQLQDRIQLLDKLGAGWQQPVFRKRATFRLQESSTEWANRLSTHSTIRWSMTGGASTSKYAIFSQGGPKRIAVTNLELASTLVGGIPEPVPSFADLELLETDEPGFFFQNMIDEHGIRWASRLQSWLELQAGDARQREAAQDLRRRLLKESG